MKNTRLEDLKLVATKYCENEFGGARKGMRKYMNQIYACKHWDDIADIFLSDDQDGMWSDILTNYFQNN